MGCDCSWPVSSQYQRANVRQAKPADTAVEQIHKTRLDINMKTARAQGLKISDSIRLRAEELIE